MAHSHNDGDTCCQSNNYDVYETLDEMKFARGLWKAAMDGDFNRVQSLLGRQYDPREVDSAGYTPLHYAARNGHSDVCGMLLSNGANPDARTRSLNATPLHRAALNGHFETVETLLNYRANANLMDADGKTALHRAITKYVSSKETLQDTSLSKTCKLLLPRTNLNIKDNTGQTLKKFILETYKKTLDELGPEDAELMKDSFLQLALERYCLSCGQKKPATMWELPDDI
ncbi:Ankyrin repeat domain-containing protein 39 [Camponotus japonicus]